jgi:hypothetical protein
VVNASARPPVEDIVRFFEERFFNRTDKVAILAPWGRAAAVRPCGGLRDLLPAHVLGETAQKAKVVVRSKKGVSALSGHFRIGSYCPGPDGSTRWLCIDFDGAGHAHALVDPLAAVLATQRAFEQHSLPSYLERSGGGKGWHLWCFFDPAIPAGDAQTIARALSPTDALLTSGDVADARSGKGIEIFPKQTTGSEKSFGNQVWLPYWFGAPEGANVFYQADASGELVAYAPTQALAAPQEAVLRALDSLPKGDTPPTAAGTKPTPSAVSTSQSPRSTGPSDWDDWRQRALSMLPLDSVYGPWLTGKSAGAGWLECRDPGSPSGDENPSASVADGTGDAEKGKFHSFRTGATVSVFDFLVEHGGACDFKEAVQRVAELAGVAMPEPPANDSPVIDEWFAWAQQHAKKETEAQPPAAQQSGGPLPPQSPPSGGGGTGPCKRRPDIQINDRLLDQIVADAWRAVHQANDDSPTVFRRSMSLVRLIAEGESMRIEDMNEASVFGWLGRVANWIRQSRETFQYTLPSHEVARDMIVYPAKELPMLHGVVNIPVYDNEGRLVATPGYNADAHLWYHPPFGFQMPAIPDRPSDSDVAVAKSLFFDELLVDFPFDEAASRAHMLGAILLPFARRLIVGPTPLHLIQAPQGGSGKGLLVNIIAIVATGHTAIGSSLPENEDEVRKKLTAELASGKPLLVIDNVDKKRQLYSPSLLAASTMWPLWTDRLLGQTKMISVPNDAVWLLNGNNPQLSDEIARRCVSIRIVPNTPQPWLRTDFRHPNLVRWTLDNRAQLVHAALILVQNWIAHGRPRGTQTMGSFESWSEVVGGILSAAGVEGILGNARKLYETTDSETTMWFDFVEAWWEAHKGDPVRVHELAEICLQRELMARVLGEGSERSQAIRLGKALLGARDRVFGAFRIEQAGKDRESKRPMYRLLDVNSGAAPTSPIGQSMELFATQ